MEKASSGLPLVTDVSFRINDAGDVFAIDFTCADGELRGVALPVTALPPLLAGVLWTGAESARRRRAAPLDHLDLRRLFERAPHATSVSAGPATDGVILAVEVGAAGAAVKISRKEALDLAERLVEALNADQTPLG